MKHHIGRFFVSLIGTDGFAVVDPEAKTRVMATSFLCVIDKTWPSGINKFLNNVTIHFGARIAIATSSFLVQASPRSQDLKFQGEVTTCEIGDNTSIRENVTISRGTASKGKTVVGNGNLLMEMHVAHDCVIGNTKYRQPTKSQK